jgi:hypothetical protein
LEAFNTIFRLIFLAFIVWTFIWAFNRKNFSADNLARIDLFAIGTVMVLGVLHLVILFYNFQDLADRAFGEYWYGLWIYPFTYFGLTQLLWFRAIRITKIIRIVIATWIFVVMYFEVFVILVTSLHRDYL